MCVCGGGPSRDGNQDGAGVWDMGAERMESRFGVFSTAEWLVNMNSLPQRAVAPMAVSRDVGSLRLSGQRQYPKDYTAALAETLEQTHPPSCNPLVSLLWFVFREQQRQTDSSL